MHETSSVQPGLFRHYKGQEYTVLGTARHSESLEELVVYRAEYGAHGLWVRPLQMFQETLQVGGQAVPRFQPVESNGEPDRETKGNIFEGLPHDLPREVVHTLVSAGHARIERIISHGHASPADFWYDQLQHEWVIVLQGAARLQFESGMVALGPGDFIHIPAAKRHRVDWTTPDETTVWLAVFYG